MEPRPPKPKTIEGEVGTPTSLDAQFLFGFPEAGYTYVWQQVFGMPDGVEYMTGHVAEVSDASGGTASFVPEVPGNYRFRLTATDSEYSAQQREVDVGVIAEFDTPLDVKGAIFADLWGEMGAPEFNSAPEDPICLAKALDHAFAGALRVGAGWVGFVPANFITQVSPTPILQPGGGLSLADGRRLLRHADWRSPRARAQGGAF